MAKYEAGEYAASNPGLVELSKTKLLLLEPSLRGIGGWYLKLFHIGLDFEKSLDKHLYLGDSGPASVISLNPLLVAAYSVDFDCVALLKFPIFLIQEHRLEVGSKLLTINSYLFESRLASDLVPGPNLQCEFTNFYPTIAEFLSDDVARIMERKSEISEEEWDLCFKMGQESRQEISWSILRHGSPLHCSEEH